MEKNFTNGILVFMILGLILTTSANSSGADIDFEMNNMRDAVVEIRNLMIDDLIETARSVWTSWVLRIVLKDYYWSEYEDNADKTLDEWMIYFRDMAIVGMPLRVNTTFASIRLSAEFANWSNPTQGELDAIFTGTGGTFESVNETTNVVIQQSSQKLILLGDATLGLPGLLTSASEVMGTTTVPGYELGTGNYIIIAANASGEGIIGWLSEAADLAALYNITAAKVTAVSNWIVETLFTHVAANDIEATAANAEDLFYQEWANASVVGMWDYPYGLALSDWGLFDANTYAIFVNKSTAEALWDETNPNSWCNAFGAELWLDAWNSSYSGYNITRDAFSLSDYYMDFIVQWLYVQDSYFIAVNNDVPNGLMPSLVNWNGDVLKQDPVNGHLYDAMSTYDYSVAQFSWQMTELVEYNGTGSIGPIFNPAWGASLPDAGFEIMLPNTTPLNIPWEVTAEMWNLTGDFAICNIDDMLEFWAPASEGDATAISALEAGLGLNTTQITAMADFVGRWRNSYMDYFMGLMATSTPTAMGLDWFYQIWATGSWYSIWHYWGADFSARYGSFITNMEFSFVNGSIDLDSYASNLSSYWGLGLAEPITGISDLFDRFYPKSLTHTNGIELWHSAICDKSSEEFLDLMQSFDLNETQMNAILSWIPVFEEKFDLLTNFCLNPTRPEIITETQTIFTNNLYLTWIEVPEADNYTVYLDDVYYGISETEVSLILFLGDGTYKLTVTAVNGTGESSPSKPVYITVDLTQNSNTIPTADFFANSTRIIIGSDIKFYEMCSGGETPLEFLWEFGDGSENSSMENPVYKYTQVGTYTVTLWVWDVDNDLGYVEKTAYIVVFEEIEPNPIPDVSGDFLDYIMGWSLGLGGLGIILGVVIFIFKRRKLNITGDEPLFLN